MSKTDIGNQKGRAAVGEQKHDRPCDQVKPTRQAAQPDEHQCCENDAQPNWPCRVWHLGVHKSKRVMWSNARTERCGRPTASELATDVARRIRSSEFVGRCGHVVDGRKRAMSAMSATASAAYPNMT